MTIQHVKSRGRASIMKIPKITLQRRPFVTRGAYGALLVIFGLILTVIDPIHKFTTWYIAMREGSFVFRMWESPSYELQSEVWIFNYTNAPQYLAGQEPVLQVQEVGPFAFREERRNLNMSIDEARGLLRMKPDTSLHFLPNQSVGHYKDINVNVPNLPLLAISTILADQLGYYANAGAYVSMTALGSKLFKNMTAEEFLWGNYDPIVTIASRLLPGWIDFGKIGILDRFYAQKTSEIEVMLRDRDSLYSIVSWDKSPGLKEQGYKDWNTSVPCNRIRGTYEGLMLTPGVSKAKEVPMFRKQACRVYPFAFLNETAEPYGFTQYRFQLKKSSFRKSSRYACPCKQNCLPDGVVDISNCYYGFPVVLSKPHFLDAEPSLVANFQGLKPDPEKHTSFFDVEPTYGVPISLASSIQANIAVRMSPGNPITKPLKDKVVPLLWISLACKGPPPEIISLLRMRFVIAPALLITAEVLLFVVGFVLGIQGFYRFFKPKYQEMLIPKHSASDIIVLENRGFKEDADDMSRENAMLLDIRDEDLELPDLVIPKA